MHTIAADPASMSRSRANAASTIATPPHGAICVSASRFEILRRGSQEIRIRPEYIAALIGPDGLMIDDWLRDGSAEVVKHGRHRTVWRVALPTGGVYAKQNRTPNWSDFARSALRGSRAMREFNAIARIAAAGLPTVEPVAVVTRRVGPFAAESFLVTRAIENTRTLEEALCEPVDSERALSVDERRIVAEHLGRIVGRMHAAGLLHRDLHAGNFLIRRETNGDLRLWLIDLQTVRQFRRLTTRQIAGELAMFEHFFKTRTTPAERLRFLRAYEACCPASCGRRAMVRDIAARSRRWSTRAFEKADRKWLRGHRKLDISETANAHVRAVAGIGDDIVRKIAMQPKACDFNSLGHAVEVEDDPRTIRWLGRRYDWSAARRIWEIGHALHRRGVPVSRPLLMQESRSGLDVVVFESDVVPLEPEAASLCQLAEAGRMIRRLHEHGFAYAGSTVPLGTIAGDLMLTDVANIVPLRERDVIDQLARLNTLTDVTPARRLRFLLEYLGPERRAEWKRVWSAVRSRTESAMGKQSSRRGLLKAALLATAALLGCQAPQKQVLLRPAQHSVRSGQLLVMSDRQIDGNDPAIRDLVQLRKQIAVTLGLKMSQEDVVVYIFDTEQEYRDYLHSAYPGLPSRRAYFVGTKEELAVYTYWGSRIQEDLRHEYTHGILHASLKTVPLWLDEGLAEYFEVGGARPGNPNSNYAARLTTAMQQGWQPAIEQLEAIEEFKQMQHIHYQESWAWVHFLLHHSPETKQVLLSYLDDLRTKRNPKPISRRLKEDLPSYAERFAIHLRQLQQPRLLSDKNYKPPMIKRAAFETPAKAPPVKPAKVSPPPFPEM